MKVKYAFTKSFALWSNRLIDWNMKVYYASGFGGYNVWLSSLFFQLTAFEWIIITERDHFHIRDRNCHFPRDGYDAIVAYQARYGHAPGNGNVDYRHAYLAAKILREYWYRDDPRHDPYTMPPWLRAKYVDIGFDWHRYHTLDLVYSLEDYINRVCVGGPTAFINNFDVTSNDNDPAPPNAVKIDLLQESIIFSTKPSWIWPRWISK